MCSYHIQHSNHGNQFSRYAPRTVRSALGLCMASPLSHKPSANQPAVVAGVSKIGRGMKYQNKEVILLDMNSTFMFEEDRFGEQEDFSIYYKSIGGQLSSADINKTIRQVFEYLSAIYPQEEYRNCFPTLQEAIDACTCNEFNVQDVEKIIETFAFYEHGEISTSYVQCLKALNKRFVMALVVDIWAPKQKWINTFKNLGIWELFSAHSFSSDHGMVKPSPKPFEMVVNDLGVSKEACLVIGDSVRRDLGGAEAAGLDCVLVGGGMSEKAVETFSTLLDFQNLVA